MSVEHNLPTGSYKLPNAMTYGELIANGKSPEQAEQIMHERVFGVGFKRDSDGMPIEVGKGSAAQPTSQHVAALAVAEKRQLMANGGGATADIIAAAVAAGVKAGLDAGRNEEAL